MPAQTKGKIGILACASGEVFAKKVLAGLRDACERRGEMDGGHPKIIHAEEKQFANTELKTVISESIRGQDVYIFQDVENKTNALSVNDNLMALKTAIDAAKRSNAHYITAVLPVFPYARQDKQISREGITAAIVAREIEDAGAHKVITLDVHNRAIDGFFRKAAFENLHAAKNITEYAKKEIDCDNLVVAAPDTGGLGRANYYAGLLQRPVVAVYKQRDYSRVSTAQGNNIEKMYLLGDVREKDVLVVDDMIDSGGTIIEAAKLFRQEGAKKVYASCALPLFNANAAGKLEKAAAEGILEKVIGTDAVTHPDSLREKGWYAEISVAAYFAEVIYRLNRYQSISELLG